MGESAAAAREAFVSEIYREGHVKKTTLLIALCILLIISSIVALTAGSARVSIRDVGLSLGGAAVDFINGIFTFIGQYVPFDFRLTPMTPDSDIASVIVVNMRLPRIMLAILTGMSLAVAGAVMQGILRNPLVSPFTLGLASASSFGAAVMIVLGTTVAIPFVSGDQSVVISAFLFGCVSMILIYGVSRMKGTSQATLILSGVVIGYIFQAGVLILKYVSTNEKLK
jgi:iron complex transport system permease protein